MELAAYPFEIVNIACRYCARKGRYRLSTLVGQCGAETTLHQLAEALARDCGAAVERTGKFGCNGVHFPDLEGTRRSLGEDGKGDINC